MVVFSGTHHPVSSQARPCCGGLSAVWGLGSAVSACHRGTVAEALKALEWADVLTWQNRITRAVVRQRDLFGRWSHRWTVIRTSNAYVFRDPQPQLAGVPAPQPQIVMPPSRALMPANIPRAR